MDDSANSEIHVDSDRHIIEPEIQIDAIGNPAPGM